MLWFGFLAFASVLLFAEFLIRLRAARAGDLALLLGASGKTPVEAVEEEREFGPREALSALAAFLGRFFPKSVLGDVAEKLDAAGKPFGLTPEQFVSLRVVAALILWGALFSASFAAGRGLLLLSLAAGGFGYLLPDMLLNSALQRRRRQVESSLMPFSDLLAVALEAGLSLNEAVLRVSEKYPGILADAWRRALRECDLGRPRAEALSEMSRRLGVRDLDYLVAALLQAEKHGTPVSSAVREEARHLRQLRQSRAEETAQKAAVKLLGPVVLFMFLPMVVLVVGPAMANLMRSLGF